MYCILLQHSNRAKNRSAQSLSPCKPEYRRKDAVCSVDNFRTAILERLRSKIAEGRPTDMQENGISANEEAAALTSLAYNSGRYRMAGRGSLSGLLAYGNANEIVVEMAHEVLTAVKHTPFWQEERTDPFMLRDYFLKQIKDMGFAGIQNFPTVVSSTAKCESI